MVFGRNIIRPICDITNQNPERGLDTLRTTVRNMKRHLNSNVPWHLHDKMSCEVLQAITRLITEIKGTYNDYTKTTTFFCAINIVVSLTELVIHTNLKKIEFAEWPKIMRHILYYDLHNMTGLEVLDLGSGSSGWKTSDIEKLVINSVCSMKNLVSFILCFDCTDNIIHAVGQNCPRLRKLDVTASRCVTNRSIPYLLKYDQLQELKLCQTSVTVSGYAELLIGCTTLVDIGRCDEFGEVLEFVNSKIDNLDSKTFNLKAFECYNVGLEHLYLIVDLCPKISSLSMLCDGRIDDLSILATLDELKELKLRCCDFYANGIQTLLEIKGIEITNLHLEHVDRIDSNALVHISQSCPNLKSLVFYNCEFLDSASFNRNRFPVPPFMFLERLKCVAECPDSHLQFLLSHCYNVKFIHLGSSTGIRDSTMEIVLSKNPMTKLEELKILHSSDLSMSTVYMLMRNCTNLRRLSELESWLGISTQELDSFRKEIVQNNIDLDTSPTLSFA